MSWDSAGFAIKAFGSLIEGENKALAYKYNAKVAQQNAEIARQQGIAAMQAQQRDAARRIGSAMANYGASGVQMDSGSPMDVLVDSARNAELDRLTVQYNYALKALGFEQQAKLDLMGAKAARTSAIFNALGATANYGAQGGFG